MDMILNLVAVGRYVEFVCTTRVGSRAYTASGLCATHACDRRPTCR